MVGAVGFAAAFLPYACAITAIKAGPAAVIINLAPAFRVASAVLWLGETLTVQCIVGAALIAVSVMVFVPGRGNQLTRPGPLALPATVPAPPEQ
jgi:O-acetylserine/cysteine efflux transporter